MGIPVDDLIAAEAECDKLRLANSILKARVKELLAVMDMDIRFGRVPRTDERARLMDNALAATK